MSDKYLTFNADKFQRWLFSLPPLQAQTCIAPLDGCVVIRLQDRFAAAGLHGYASAIQSVIEAAKDAGVPLPTQLEDVRDYFFEMAQAAEAYPHKKWPD